MTPTGQEGNTMEMITKHMNAKTSPVTILPNPMQQMRELTTSELANITGGGDKNTWCDCKHAKPTGVVIKRWVVKGYVYYRDVQLKCPDCGEISYRSKLF